MTTSKTILETIVGHEVVIERLRRAFSNEEYRRAGQCFLFVGPEGIGKKTVALGLSQMLICEKGDFSLKIIEPEGLHIKIEQVREVLKFLSLRMWGRHRVILIDQVQGLNPQAANALLKTLEEPPDYTVFFLIAPSLAGVLPTVRSRSRIVAFRPLSMEQMARLSAGFSGGKGGAPALDWILRASHGSLTRLKELGDAGESELRTEAAQWLYYFLEDAAFLLNEPWRDAFKDRRRAQKVIGYWTLFIRDGFFVKRGQLAEPEFLTTLFSSMKKMEEAQLLHFWQKLIVLERDIAANRDTQLLLESLWIEVMKPMGLSTINLKGAS